MLNDLASPETMKCGCSSGSGFHPPGRPGWHRPMAEMGHERSSPLAKPTARFRPGARDHFDVPLIACTVASKTSPPARPRRCRIRILASLRQGEPWPGRPAARRRRCSENGSRTRRARGRHHTMPRSRAAQCADLPVASTGVQVGAIFDVRALLTPPLAAERMVRLSTR
jgi:hypothetical protein